MRVANWPRPVLKNFGMVEGFINSHLAQMPDGAVNYLCYSVAASDLYADYCTWCRKAGHWSVSKNEFLKAVVAIPGVRFCEIRGVKAFINLVYSGLPFKTKNAR